MITQTLPNQHLSQRDQDFLALALSARNTRNHPEVGDYIRFQDGSLRRISYNHGDKCQHSVSGSFYLNSSGHSSFSGGLDAGVKVEAMELMEEVKDGSFWIWRDGRVGAGCGVDVSMPCRVWSYTRHDVLPDTWERQHEYWVLVLDQNQPAIGCGYRVIVTKGGSSHAAFHSTAEMTAWMIKNGLQCYAEGQDHRGVAYWAGKAE